MLDALISHSEFIPSVAELACCLACRHPLEGRSACLACGRAHPVEAGILHAIEPLVGTNRTAARFYDGPNWRRFRPWEQLFLWFQGPGPRAARKQILRHLPDRTQARVLEVGIGDGENLPMLPETWAVYGVDIARSQLSACRARHPNMDGRLVWAEGESLPFADQSFDAVYTIGGFNYFRDQAQALREMRRVARPEAPLIVADELPDLYRFAPGHAFGFEALDRWGLRLMGLDPDFIEMVLSRRVEVDALVREVLPGACRFPIWNRLGYCFVDPDPRRGLALCR